jgi:hypothetical protein
MGGLLTVPQFLNRFPQLDTLDPSQTSFHNAWVTGEFKIVHSNEYIFDDIRSRGWLLEPGLSRLCYSLHTHQ